tara:strand:- start:21 stop:449 length:429 start_codon:yes stop_codon:yes gene_type:complete
MAHYAVLDNNNIVTLVHVGKNEDEGDINWEEYYGAKRTSYNTRGGVYYSYRMQEIDAHDENGDPFKILHEVSFVDDTGTPFRKNFAAVGFTYDDERDAFIPPQPYASWTLNEDTCLWDSPVPYPSDGVHEWDEENQEWVEYE